MRIIKIPYKPRELLKPAHDCDKRFTCLVCHRRMGKTYFAVNKIIKDSLCNERTFPPPIYAYIAPYQKQAKKITWKYFKHFLKNIPSIKFNGEHSTITLPNGAIIFVIGADNPDALRGDYLDGAVLDEFGDMRPSVLPEIIMPMLSDYKGWLTILGTPKGRNQFYDIRILAEKSEFWYFIMLKASETGIVDAEELQQQREMMTEAQYQQEFECSFNAAVIGAYYADEMSDVDKEGRVKPFKYDKSLPVHTAWDLGVGHPTCIWFAQFSGTELHLIDYYQSNRKGADHYVKVLKDKPYVYGRHILPHDVRVQDWGSGKTRIETLISLGIRPEICPNVGLDDGINAVRLALPHCYFNEKETSQGVEALRHYHSEVDDKKSRSMDSPHLKAKPAGDWADDPADSFRYLCVSWKKERGTLVEAPRGIENITIDEYWDMEKVFNEDDEKI